MGSEPLHSSESIQSLARSDGDSRPICGATSVRQMADFVSDFDRLNFSSPRGLPRIVSWSNVVRDRLKNCSRHQY